MVLIGEYKLRIKAEKWPDGSDADLEAIFDPVLDEAGEWMDHIVNNLQKKFPGFIFECHE